MTIYLGMLLHIYQPPTQLPSVLRRIVNESYRPLLKTFKKYEHVSFTLNINATLTEQLVEEGYEDVIGDLVLLASRGQLEFTGSGKYHPILPFLPREEIIRQINLNFETNRKILGRVYNPVGFFPPEMAYAPNILKPIEETGHKWFIMAGIGCTKTFPVDKVYKVKGSSLHVLHRDDWISNDISFHHIPVNAFFNRLKYVKDKKDYYIIIALDGETFGHHVKGNIENFLEPLLKSAPQHNVKITNLTEVYSRFASSDEEAPRASSWSTLFDDIARGVEFPLWFDPSNRVHVLQHNIMMQCLGLYHTAKKYLGYNSSRKFLDIARHHLDEAVHSCQNWWASKRPWYDVDMVLRGVSEFIMAAVNIRKAIPTDTKLYIAFTEELKILLKQHEELLLLL